MSATAATTSAFTRAGPGWRYRVESIPVRRVGDLGIALVFLAASGALMAVNMMAAPARLIDEAVLVNRAWTLDNGGTLARLTDWYDHPPLGWLQLGLWSSLTGAADRASTGIGGRELMLVAQLASAALLWVLARRLGFSRAAAAGALVLFAVSPLAVHLHRQISLDNLATPWVIAAFVLACRSRRQLAAFAGGGACFAVAVLTNEVALVFLPALGWQMWRASSASTRRYTLTVAGSLFALLCGIYVLAAALQGGLVSGAGHAGLLNGVHFQFVEQASVGSVLDSDSAAHEALASWFDLDPVGLVLILAAAPLAWVVAPRLRPVAAAVLLLVVFAVTVGNVSASLIVGALPFGALLVAGLAQQALRQSRAMTIPVAALGVAAVAIAVPGWVTQHPRLLTDPSDAALREAESWIVANIPDDSRLIVDDVMWVDLVEAGFHPERVVSYGALDMDPDLGPAAPGGWRDYQLLVATSSLRSLGNPYVEARTATRHSISVADFGSDQHRVQVRSIVADGPISAAIAHNHDPVAAATLGDALTQNPSITFAREALDALSSGEVDERLMTPLVALAVDHRFEVSGFPVDPAEVATGAPRRVVELRAVSDSDANAMADMLRAQEAPYRPADIDVGADGALTVTYPPAPLGGS